MGQVCHSSHFPAISVPVLDSVARHLVCTSTFSAIRDAIRDGTLLDLVKATTAMPSHQFQGQALDVDVPSLPLPSQFMPAPSPMLPVAASVPDPAVQALTAQVANLQLTVSN